MKLYNKVLDIVLDLQKLPDDTWGFEFEYDGLEYYMSILFDREVVPTPTPQDLPQEYTRKKDILHVLDVDVFNKEGDEIDNYNEVIKLIHLIEDFYN